MLEDDVPARHQPFVGRQRLLRSIDRALELGRSLSVCGGPEIGKSAVLAETFHRVEQRFLRQPSSTRVVPVHLAARGLGEDEQRWAGAIVQAVLAAFSRPQVNVGVDLLELSKEKPPRQEPFKHVNSVLEKAFQRLSGTKSWHRWALLVDDADALSSLDTEGVQQGLADLIGGHSDWAPRSVLLFGGRALAEVRSDRYNPLKGVRVLEMGALHDAEVKHWVNKSLPQMPSETFQSLLAFSGGHPSLIRRALASWREGGPQLPIEEIQELHHDSIEQWCERVWDEFDLERGVSFRGAYAAPEHALMQYLLEVSKPVTIEQAENELAIKSLREYATFLHAVGVVRRHIDRDEPALAASCGAFNRWYRQRVNE